MKTTIYIILHLLLLLQYNVFSQEDINSFEFQPLSLTDTLKTKKEITSLIPKYKTKNPLFFFVESYSGRKGLYLVEKVGSYLVVYLDVSDMTLNAPNGVLSKPKAYNSRYVGYTLTVFKSGMGTNIYVFYNLIDLKTKSYLSLNCSSYNANNDGSIVSECQSAITFTNNKLLVDRDCKKTTDKNYCNNCLKSGVYLIKNQYLKKEQPKPIAVGMTIKEVKRSMPDATYKVVPDKYGNCASDPDVKNVEVWQGKMLSFVLEMNSIDSLSKKEPTINSIYVISPKYKFKEINTSLTAEAVLNKYPNAKLKQDELTEEESLTIDELNITVHFKSTKELIGIYNSNGVFEKLNQPTAKIEYISTTRL